MKSEKQKIEISQWEAGQLLDILMIINSAYSWKDHEGIELSDNEMLKNFEPELKEKAWKRMNSLVKKLEKINEKND